MGKIIHRGPEAGETGTLKDQNKEVDVSLLGGHTLQGLIGHLYLKNSGKPK